MRTTRLVAIPTLALSLLVLAPRVALAAGDVHLHVLARVSGQFVAKPGSEPPGFDVDLLHKFAAWRKSHSGAETKIEFAYSPTVPALLEAVIKGTAEVGVGGVTATAERAKSVDFSAPTLPVRSVVIAPQGVLDANRWREQIKGLRVGATVGSTNAAEVGRIAGVKANTTFPTNEAVFEALVGAGRSLDAAIVDLPQYWVNGKSKGLVLVDNVGEPQSMAFVLKKGSPLKAELDQFLEDFTHRSEYFQLIQRYFGQDAAQMVKMSKGGG